MTKPTHIFKIQIHRNIALKPEGGLKESIIRSGGTKTLQEIILYSFLLLINSCITEFIPEVYEEKELLVVEGLITDQPGTNTIKLSKSLPFGVKSDAKPLNGCIVKISDNLGNEYYLKENEAGTYITDSANFKGVIGRVYTLKISTTNANNYFHYESFPMEMKSVPPLDSIYYEKTVIKEDYGTFFGIDGCQIYLNTIDPANTCKYYRWDFSETWVLRLLFPVDNMTCWITEQSKSINIKSTAAFNEAKILRYPINYINNTTDRLKTEYSILVNQYSMNEDEYIYWEKMQNINVQAGGLYDLIPASVPSNMECIEKPDEKVLGYFSVSAKASKRIFIKDNFSGIIDRYNKCITDTVYTDNPPGLGTSVWILVPHPYSPPYWIITDDKGCADCTMRGTNIKPDFWDDDKY
jgi:hypothetical protein